MSSDPQIRDLQTDFLARLADAWDLRGSFTLAPSRLEHRALLELAQLPPALATAKWAELRGDERFKLLVAARRVIEFGRQCAWIFGEGQGARF